MEKRTRQIGLRGKVLAVVLAVYLCIGGAAYVALESVLNRVTQQLGLDYAGQYALANSALIREPLEREIALSRLLAESSVVREWVLDEKNEAKRTQAFKELKSYQNRFGAQCWFIIVHDTLSYYFDSPEHSYGPTGFAYTLSPEKPEDQWYFATVAAPDDFSVNVNYDHVLDVHKVWINVPMRTPEGRVVGLAGTSLDLSQFLRNSVERTEPGVDVAILDRRMAIQAHRNRELIDEHSIAKSQEEMSRIDRIITNPEDLEAVRVAFSKLQQGSSSETFMVEVDGDARMAGLARIATLDWYVLTLLDSHLLIGAQYFAPTVALSAAVAFILFVITGFTVSRMVLRPVLRLTDATKRIAEGDYSVSITSKRQDELGILTRTFSSMSARIRDYTANLEQGIQERTEQLNAANQDLRENMDRLEEALASVRTLEGILPICASCKKIRDEEGEWTSMEYYVARHSEAKFSHGICPNCIQEIYPDIKIHRPKK